MKNICKVKGAEVTLSKELLETIKGKELGFSEKYGVCEMSSFSENENYILFFKADFCHHQLMLMLQDAFFNHKAVTISPDTIWLLICQGFSKHIKLHSETFRSLFTESDEKQIIEVQRDDFVLGEKNPWEEVIPEFTKQISARIDVKLHEVIVQNFSTTTFKETIAFELAFMDSVSDYFDYLSISLCGIPEIHILGTIEDYTKILDATEQLRTYKLDWWIDKVQPHIKQFINALKGKQDPKFWNSIYKHNNESGGPFITGWITHFFPYLEIKSFENEGKVYYKKGVLEEDVLKITPINDGSELKHSTIHVKNPCLKENGVFKAILSDFPSSFSIVPMTWNCMGQEIEMEFISGFMGIQENPENYALKTDINWILNRK